MVYIYLFDIFDRVESGVKWVNRGDTKTTLIE